MKMIETPWGYDIDAESMPTILTVEEFNTLTANKYASDQRVASTLASATSAMRNWCGWHLSGNVSCQITYAFYDLHITHTHHGMSIILPTRCLTEVTHIDMDGEDATGSVFHVKRRGQVDLYGCRKYFKKITITFKSGLSDDGIKAVLASRVSNTLSGPVGVNSESAGGVSISYAASYVAGASSTTLLTADKEFLEAYKIEEML